MNYYCCSGIIGAGKTNLTLTLANLMDWHPIKEPVKTNPYLETFYKDLAENKCKETRSAFTMQIYLLIRRFAEHQKAISICTNKTVIGDRSIFEDTIFARILYADGHISKLDYQTYLMSYNALKHRLRYPIFLYIDITPEEAYKRLQQRNRSCEADVPLDYLKKLHVEYGRFKNHMSRYSVVLTVPAEDVFYPEKVIEIIENFEASVDPDALHYKK